MRERVHGTRVVLLGAGEVATGVAVRLHRCGFSLLLTEIAEPRAVRRLVAFSESVFEGRAVVEGIAAARVYSLAEAARAAERGEIPVLVDGEGLLWPGWSTHLLVDARMKKGGHGLFLRSAPCVIGLGPGFTAGRDCTFAVETLRGPNLGRLLSEGSPAPDTGIPGTLGGENARRVLHSPADGIFQSNKMLGEILEIGDEVGTVGGAAVAAEIGGVLRGLLRPGLRVRLMEKVADVDPRIEGVDIRVVSDRSLAIAGAVLEGILRWEANDRRGKSV